MFIMYRAQSAVYIVNQDLYSVGGVGTNRGLRAMSKSIAYMYVHSSEPHVVSLI